jgi:hypothetical protein
MTRADSGTCCFLQTEKVRCVATCAHVWDGFLRDRAEKGAGVLWLSLVANGGDLAPSCNYEVPEPALIGYDAGLDLATFAFEGIDALEPWRFHRLRSTTSNSALKGEFVFFLGYTGDVLRMTSANRRLGFTLFALQVADVGYRQFVLHDSPGERHWTDASGEKLQPQRISGVSGAPVFRFAKLGADPLDLSIAGFVSQLSSPGLVNAPAEPVDVHSKQGYEMSDGDIYVAQSRLIHADGSIQE